MKKNLIASNWFAPVFSAIIVALYLLLFFLPIYSDKIIPLESIEQSLWGMPIITLITPPDIYNVCLSMSVFGLIMGSFGFGLLIKRSMKEPKTDKLCLYCLLASMVAIPILLSFLSSIFYEPIGILAGFIISMIGSPIISSLIMLVVFLVSKKTGKR